MTSLRRASLVVFFVSAACSGGPGVQLGQPDPCEGAPRQANCPKGSRPAPATTPQEGDGGKEETPTPTATSCATVPALAPKQTCIGGVNPAEWDVETLRMAGGAAGGLAELQIGPAGSLHVAMVGDKLQYASNSTASWVIEEKVAEGVDPLRPPRVAIDACGNVALLYRRGGQGHQLARRQITGPTASNNWIHEKVPLATPTANGADVAYDKSNRLQFVGHAGTSEVRAVDALTLTQWGQASAEESAELPIFAVGVSTRPSFFVAEPDTGYPMVIEAGNKSSVIAEKRLTKSLAAVVDRFETVHVAWQSNDTVWYARRQKNESWSAAEEVVTTQSGVSRVSLVIGPTLVPYVLVSPSATVYMRSTSTWRPNAIPSATGQAMAMTIDGSGRLYVLQSDTDTAIKLLKQKCL